MRFSIIAASFGLLMPVVCAWAQNGTGHVTVRVDQPGVKISPTLYGMMTEEINHAYDGGLYAELIRNRDFKDNNERAIAWSLEGAGSMALDDSDPVTGTALTRCLKVVSTGAVAVVSDGFWGVPIKPNTTYTGSFYAKGDVSFSVSLDSGDAGSVAIAEVGAVTSEWKQYHFKLTTHGVAANAKGKFKISTSGASTFYLTQVSLFPPTFHNHPNGNRPDLINLMAAMHPSFLRLPGGNYLEGDTIAERFNSKETLGDLSQRPGHQCPWGYRSSDGMGLMEYMEWCDELHIQPVLAVYAGYSLQQQYVKPGPDLTPYVQDAVDEIEFVTGSTNTKWGALRAKLGHRGPWKLTYVEVGNEDAFDRSRSYDGRFAQFFDAIKAKYPKLQLIATARVNSRKPDVMDDHYYRSAAAMARDATHYDSYDRKGPKIFVGEWASMEGSPTPNHRAALGDAAWLTGLERNSDVVVMESYAPLFVNVNRDAWQWRTNLIGYDSLTSFGSPSYYVQSMFGANTGDVVLPVNLVAASPKKPVAPPHGAVGLGTWVTDSEYKDLSVKGAGVDYHKDFGATGKEGWTFPRGSWTLDGGSVRQTTEEEDTAAIGGDKNWGDYTLHVQARKMGGAEGFLVRFHVHDADNYWQWNVGGWGDTRSALQRIVGGEAQEVGRPSQATIATGKWYDIRIEVAGGRIQCYLDGKLTNSAQESTEAFVEPLYVAASEVRSTGEVILKVVNVSENAMDLNIDLPGAGALEPDAQGWELTGLLDDQNSVEHPLKVAPKPIVVHDVGLSFNRTFPAYSVTVLRLKH